MTAAKERPILFSGPMVRALLAGRKTQTRRIVKADYQAVSTAFNTPLFEPQASNWYLMRGAAMDRMGVCLGPCPYGVVGDRLWVRETFFCNDFDYPNGPRERLLEEMYYRADGIPDFEGEQMYMQWRPSIHMPRWASRILLEITEVHVERLQAISEGDAVAEGVLLEMGEDMQRSAYWAYRALWGQINGPDSWAENPWVWVVSFQRVLS